MTTRIPSETTDQYVPFVAVDSTDRLTLETGLTGFTVYRQRENGTATLMTTPTTIESSSANMAGLYKLLCDEDMTIGSGNDEEEMTFRITHASMAPVTVSIQLFRPKLTEGNTLDVTATGAAGIDWANIENKTTANDLSGTIGLSVKATGLDLVLKTSIFALAIADANLDEALSGHIIAGSLGKAISDIEVDTSTTIPAILGTPTAADMSTDIANMQIDVDSIITNIGLLNDISAADVNTEVLDVMATDTIAESSGVPAAVASAFAKITYIYDSVANKSTQTATTRILRNRADAVTISTATLSDDTVTLIKGTDT